MRHNHTTLGQMLQMFSRFEFQKAVKETKTEYNALGFQTWNHLLIGNSIIRDSPSYATKAAKNSRFAHETFTTAFPTKKRQPSCKHSTRNRTFCQE